MSGVFDPGLQPERTLLAWRRTCLALAVGSAVMARLTVPFFGTLAVIIGLGGIVLAAVSYLHATRRYRKVHVGLTGRGELPGDGSAVALVAGGLILMALLCAGFVAFGAFGPGIGRGSHPF